MMFRLSVRMRSISNPSLIISGIAVVGLILRIAWALLAPHVDPFIRSNPLYGDATGYDILAKNLLRGLGLTWNGVTPTSARAPGYPALLAVLYWLGGYRLEVIRIFQAFLSALTCFPVYWIGRRLCSTSTGLLAALGWALYPLGLYFVPWLVTESVTVLALWTALATTLYALDSRRPSYAILSGILFGITALFRPVLLLLPAANTVPALLMKTHRRRLSILLVVILATFMTIAPWTVRNRLAHNAWVVIATNSGLNFYGGNNALADGGYRSDLPPTMLPGMSEPESERQYYNMAFAWIKEHPAQFLALLPKKLLRFFSALETTTGQSGVSLGSVTTIINLIYWAFLLVASYGIYRLFRLKPFETALLLGVPILYNLFFALVFYGGSRYALPVMPAFLIGASHILVSSRVRKRE